MTGWPEPRKLQGLSIKSFTRTSSMKGHNQWSLPRPGGRYRRGYRPQGRDGNQVIGRQIPHRDFSPTCPKTTEGKVSFSSRLGLIGAAARRHLSPARTASRHGLSEPPCSRKTTPSRHHMLTKASELSKQKWTTMGCGIAVAVACCLRGPTSPLRPCDIPARGSRPRRRSKTTTAHDLDLRLGC